MEMNTIKNDGTEHVIETVTVSVSMRLANC